MEYDYKSTTAHNGRHPLTNDKSMNDKNVRHPLTGMLRYACGDGLTKNWVLSLAFALGCGARGGGARPGNAVSGGPGVMKGS
jgi:hypothetical protein